MDWLERIALVGMALLFGALVIGLGFAAWVMVDDPSGVKMMISEVPDCPESGFSYHETVINGLSSANEERIRDAYQERGWHNITIRHEGAGGWASPDSVRVMGAACHVEVA